jgi:hypothetical protein
VVYVVQSLVFSPDCYWGICCSVVNFLPGLLLGYMLLRPYVSPRVVIVVYVAQSLVFSPDCYWGICCSVFSFLPGLLQPLEKTKD